MLFLYSVAAFWIRSKLFWFSIKALWIGLVERSIHKFETVKAVSYKAY